MVGAHDRIHILLRLVKLLVTRVEFFQLNFFLRIRLHRPDPGQTVINDGIDIGDLDAVIHKRTEHFFPVEKSEQPHQNGEDQEDHCESHMSIHQNDESPDNLDQRNQKIFRSVVGQLRNILQVCDDARNHLSRAGVIKEREGQLFHMREQILPHVPLDTRPQNMPPGGNEFRRQTLDHIKSQHENTCRDQNLDDPPLVTQDKNLINQGPHDPGEGQACSTYHHCKEHIRSQKTFIRFVITDKTRQIGSKTFLIIIFIFHTCIITNFSLAKLPSYLVLFRSHCSHTA